MTDQLIKEVLEIVRSSKDFVLAQAPELAREVVYYARVENAVEVLLGVVGIVIIFFGYRKVRAKVDSGEWDDELAYPLSFIVALFGGIGSIVAICDGISDGTKAFLAPKLYLLEYLSHLVKH